MGPAAEKRYLYGTALLYCIVRNDNGQDESTNASSPSPSEDYQCLEYGSCYPIDVDCIGERERVLEVQRIFIIGDTACEVLKDFVVLVRSIVRSRQSFRWVHSNSRASTASEQAHKVCATATQRYSTHSDQLSNGQGSFNNQRLRRQ